MKDLQDVGLKKKEKQERMFDAVERELGEILRGATDEHNGEQGENEAQSLAVDAVKEATLLESSQQFKDKL